MLTSKQENSRRAWLERHCPSLWSLLNTKARRTFPAGLVVYLSPPDTIAGGRNLRAADHGIAHLVERCGQKAVEGAYRRDMSAVSDERQLRDLLCETSAAAAIASIADEPPRLRSRVGQKKCDLTAMIGGHTAWLEVKRVADDWLFDDERPPERGRALSMAAYTEGTRPADRPASDVLRSKLDGRRQGRPPDGVPEQLPDGKLGLLFLFYSSVTIDESHVRAALFGDGFFGMPDASGQSVGFDHADYALQYACNGLFALRRWQRVSACCWVRAPCALPPLCSPFRLLRTWHNPLAETLLPPEVAWALQRMCRAKD